MESLTRDTNANRCCFTSRAHVRDTRHATYKVSNLDASFPAGRAMSFPVLTESNGRVDTSKLNVRHRAMHRPFTRRERLTVSVFLLAALSAGGCTSQHADPSAVPKVPVTVAQVVKKSVPLAIEAIGSVLPYRTVSVEPQVTGQLLSVHFQEGQDVKKGKLLFSIEPAPFQAALDQALGKLAHDKAQAANSALILERTEHLYAEKVNSKEQLDQARAAAAEDQAAVRTDEAAFEYARLQLSYCTLYSPVDGRTGSLLVHPGNQVKANDQPVLVVINQITPVYVAYSIPERYLPDVRKYMAKSSLAVEAVIPDDPQHPELGTLTFVDNTVDRATGTIQLKATFPNRNRRLWPGQFVNTIVRLAEQTNAIVVPSQAIETGQKGTFVYVIKSDQTAEIRPVTVERNAGAEAVISAGLHPGETVVTDGQIMIFPGAHLQVKNPPAAAPPSR